MNVVVYARYSSHRQGEQSIEGQLAEAQSTSGNRPLGYKTGPDKKFVIDPETAPTVRFIYDLYVQGQIITQIIRTLKCQRTPNEA